MPSINWNENSPAGADSVSLGAGEFRSLKTALRSGLDAEHAWPSTGGDAGVHRMGSARPYFGPQSAVSSTGSDARLMVTSDTSCLFHVGSGGTSLIGGPTVISAGSYPGGSAPQRYYWAEEFGVGHQTTSTGTRIVFPNSGYSGQPIVTVSAWSDGGLALLPIVHDLTATSFVVVDGFSNSNHSIMWRSIGTRVL